MACQSLARVPKDIIAACSLDKDNSQDLIVLFEVRNEPDWSQASGQPCRRCGMDKSTGAQGKSWLAYPEQTKQSPHFGISDIRFEKAEVRSADQEATLMLPLGMSQITCILSSRFSGSGSFFETWQGWFCPMSQLHCRLVLLFVP